MQNLPTIKLSELTSIYSTVSLINKFIHYPIKERITITIDFKGEFVNPICLGLVASALQLLKSNYKEVLINLVNTDSIIFGYAKRMDFINYCESNYFINTTKFTLSNNLIEITSFNETNDNNVAERIVNLIKNRSRGVNQDIIELLHFCMGEIISNVTTHSKSKTGGLAVAQFYPKNNEFKILVCDNGIGIHESLTSNDKYAALSESQALFESFKKGVTSGDGMGMGLFYTSRFMESNKGILELYSSNHRYYQRGSYKGVYPHSNWQGVALYLKVNTEIEFNPEFVTEGYTGYKATFDFFFD